jgi:hypothetical protein
MSWEFFDTLPLGKVVYWDGEIYPNIVRFFVRKKYTIFSIERIVALLSVSNIFPESYGFAANDMHELSLKHRPLIPSVACYISTCNLCKPHSSLFMEFYKNRMYSASRGPGMAIFKEALWLILG